MEDALVGSFGGRQVKDTGWSGLSSGGTCGTTSANPMTERSEDTIRMEPVKVNRVSLQDSKRQTNWTLCHTDHLEYIKRHPAGRLCISLSHLTGASVKAETANARELKTRVTLETGVTVSARELKKRISSEQLFAVINNLADPHGNLSHEWADQREGILANNEVQLDVPTPDYSSPSEDEDGELIDSVMHGSTTNKANNVELYGGVELHMSGAKDISPPADGALSNDLHDVLSHGVVVPMKLVRKGSVIRRKTKKKFGADVASLSEPEDNDRSRYVDNDEVYAIGDGILQNMAVSVPSKVAGERQTSTIVTNQSSAENRRKR